MSDAFWLNFFEERAAQREQVNTFSVNGFVDVQQAKKIRKEVLDIVKKLKPSIVIDCGCGDGTVAKSISRYCKSILGVEIAPSMCELARRKNIEVVNTSVYSSIDCNSELHQRIKLFPKNNLLLLFCESLVCVERPNYLIESIQDVLPGIQYYLISSPNRDSILRRIFVAPATSRLNYLNFKNLELTMKKNSYVTTNKIFVLSIPFLYSIKVQDFKVRSPFLKRLLTVLSTNIIYLFSLERLE